MRARGLGLLLVGLSGAVVAASPMPSPNWPGPAPRADRELRRAALSVHNDARREFGVAPLAWNQRLADAAETYARRMAATNVYRHDSTPGRRKLMGENLWRGPRGVFAYDVMISTMVDERRHFRGGAFPNVSRTGQWLDVSHYTQIVWPTTTEVGCGLASNARYDYFVCRYAPTGNKDGITLAPGRSLGERGR
ncbi:CAP domain-containing protein [Sphingomonas rhizophila]|nr:CAP domain-containing protein [Sphingomonas rhizophila]